MSPDGGNLLSPLTDRRPRATLRPVKTLSGEAGRHRQPSGGARVGCVAFLLSEEASYVTGVNVEIAGGST